MKKNARQGPIRRKLVAAAVAACFAAPIALANPTGPTVGHGTAAIHQSGNLLQITNSPNAVINWQSFSIGANEITRFLQQSPSSAVLNRVITQNPSQILGTLQSNGRVFLINPNGILFGAGAQVDVAGLVASTLNLSDSDFLGGRLRFTDGLGKSVVNDGSIATGAGGSVYLIGSGVANNGLIRSPQGEVVLAAGNSVELVSPGTPNLRVEITATDNEARNLGQIISEAGRIGIYAGLINHSGTVRADSAVSEGGRILLKATKSLTLEAGSVTSANGASGGRISIQSGDTTLVAGTVEATGSEDNGGRIELLGERVGLMNAAAVDASGKTGGGSVLVGGDYQGGNPEVKNSAVTYVASDVTIKADAVTEGDGGKVIVWADDTTRFGGAISARGGSLGGDGGFVEVSGKDTLVFRGTVDTRAPRGKTGTLLLDPANITISNGTGDSAADGDALANSFSGAPSGATGTVIGTDNPAAGTLTLFESELEGIAATTSISLAASNNITINNLTDNVLNLAQTAGNSVTFNAGGAFSMNAGDTIQTAGGAVNVIAAGNATLGAVTTAGGALNVTSGGAATLGAIAAAGGAITIDVGAASTAGGVISGAGTSLTKQGGGTLTLSGNNTYTGATTVGAGTLSLGAANRIANASAVTVAGGATFNLNGFAETVGSIAGAGNVTLGAGTLTAGGDNSSTTHSGVISGAGGLIKAGTGTLTLSGANTYTGVTRINAGTLSAALLANGGVASNIGASTNAAANLVLAGGALQYTGPTVSTNRNFTLIAGTASTVDVTTGGTTLTIAGASTGTTGALTKAGPGTLTLSGANLYTGLTTVNAGTLRYGANNALATGAVTVNDGGTYDLAGFSDSIGALTVNSGATGGAVTTGAGTLTLTGNITSTGGAANASIAGNLAFGATRTITTTNANDGLDISAVISGAGGLIKAGTGTLTLSGANTYTGTTTISAGTLSAASATALGTTAGGTSVTSGATLQITNVALGAEPVSLNGTGVGGIGALTGAGTASLAGPVTLASASRIGVGSGNTLALSGTIEGPGALEILGGGAVTLGGTVGSTTALASFSGAAGTTLAIDGGLVRTAGGQTYDGATTLGAAATLRTTAGGSVSASGAITATAGTLTLDTGAGDATLGNNSNDLGSVVVTSGGAVTLVDSNAITVGPASMGSLTARTLTGDLTLGGNVTASGGGDSILLVAGGNFNNPGSFSLNPGAGRWLVYSTDPASDNRGGLESLYAFKQYGLSYSGPYGGPGTGNGLIYSITPNVAPSLVGSAARTYDGAATAPTASLTVSPGAGVIDSDTVTLALAGAAYDTKHVGTGKLVTASGISIATQTNAGRPVYGYTTNPTASANVGVITAAPLTVTAQTDTRGYDGTTSSAVAPVVTGTLYDAVGTAAIQSYDTKHVGTGKTLTASGLAVNDGNSGNNYAITYVVDTTGVITAAPLTVTAQTDSRGYNGTTGSSIAPAVTGTLYDAVGTAATQSYDTKHAATGKTLTASGLVVNDGNSGNNYAVTYVTDTTGVISAAPLSITADNASRPVNQPNPPFTVTYSGFQTGDTPGSLTGTLNFTTPASISSPAGAYPITPSGPSSTNYAITYVDGTLTVSAAPVSAAAFANPLIPAVNYWVPDPQVAASSAPVALAMDESLTPLPPTAAGPGGGAQPAVAAPGAPVALAMDESLTPLPPTAAGENAAAPAEAQPRRVENNWKCFRHGPITSRNCR